MDTKIEVSFYPEKKQHTSPSALQNWFNSRSNFIKSYFAQEPFVETAAIKAGKKFHKMIEVGLIDVEKRFEHKEKTLSFPVTESVNALGIPDSHEESFAQTVEFVDYKTGKENTWTKEKLATDLKMKFTAYLVWVANDRKPQAVKSHIEWIGTEWDGTELVLSGERDLISWDFLADELAAFENVILSQIAEVNEEYPKWLESSSDFVSEEDVEEFAQLESQKAEIEAKQKVIKERIGEQMKFGGVKNYSSPFGSFYFTETKKYDIPDDLEFTTESGNHITRAFALEVATAMSVADKNYKTEHDPVSVTTSIGFRAKKSKSK